METWSVYMESSVSFCVLPITKPRNIRNPVYSSFLSVFCLFYSLEMFKKRKISGIKYTDHTQLISSIRIATGRFKTAGAREENPAEPGWQTTTPATLLLLLLPLPLCHYHGNHDKTRAHANAVLNRTNNKNSCFRY